MIDVREPVQRILAARAESPKSESLLVAVSGIDASGKGYLTQRIVDALQREGVNTVGINLDGWLNLPSVRFAADNPGEHFYRHAIRFDEMFDSLVLPLKRNRSIRLKANLVEETAVDYHQHTYAFDDVDIIVLEGIFLLKREFRHLYDLTFWVECSFETAIERAFERGQEGLSTAETIRAYETIYFPAQRAHFALDTPKSMAQITLFNDPRLKAVATELF